MNSTQQLTKYVVVESRLVAYATKATLLNKANTREGAGREIKRQYLIFWQEDGRRRKKQQRVCSRWREDNAEEASRTYPRYNIANEVFPQTRLAAATFTTPCVISRGRRKLEETEIGRGRDRIGGTPSAPDRQQTVRKCLPGATRGAIVSELFSSSA